MLRCCWKGNESSFASSSRWSKGRRSWVAFSLYRRSRLLKHHRLSSIRPAKGVLHHQQLIQKPHFHQFIFQRIFSRLNGGSIEKARKLSIICTAVVVAECGNESIRAITSRVYCSAQLSYTQYRKVVLVGKLAWEFSGRFSSLSSSTLASRWTYPSHRSEFALNWTSFGTQHSFLVIAWHSLSWPKVKNWTNQLLLLLLLWFLMCALRKPIWWKT